MLASPYFRRLFLPFLVLSLAGALAVGLWGATRIRALLLDQTRDALLHQAYLLEDQLADLFNTAGNAAQQRLQLIAARIDKHLTLTAPDGRVLADSAQDPALMANQADFPEIRAALEQGPGSSIRRSPALQQDVLYVAWRRGPAETPAGVTRVGAALGALDAAMRALYAQLALGVGTVLAVMTLASYAIARSLTRPVVQLAAAAHRLASGDFDQRIDIDDAGELGLLAGILNHMAASLGRLVQRVAEDQQELQAVLGSMVEGVIAVDSRQTVRMANESAARMFEFELESSKGRGLKQVVRHPRVLELAEEVSRTGQLLHARVGPTAGALDLDILICPLKADQPLRGFVLVANDVAESHRYQQLRSEFVANVSHELRTPLALILGFVETLQDGAKDDTEKRDRFLDGIERNARQLSNLVNDLLDLSELEERRGEGAWQELDLGALAARVCETLRPVAETKRQRLTLAAGEHLPAVRGQQRDLERAISNLVDNAIKYTDTGGWISVEVQPRGAHVAVVVEDTGIGIPAEDLPRIFERFFRVHKSRSRQMGGTGLGLSIVKHVVQAHAGSIEVDSRPGQGSRFTLVLPVTGSVPAQGSGRAESQPGNA